MKRPEGSNPLLVAKTILRSVNQRVPKPRYLIGFAAKPLVFLKLVLPVRLFDRIIKNIS